MISLLLQDRVGAHLDCCIGFWNEGVDLLGEIFLLLLVVGHSGIRSE